MPSRATTSPNPGRIPSMSTQSVPHKSLLPASGRALASVDHESCQQLESALSREWLITDGRGGYASSTIVQCATRKYHGLLVAPTASTAKRYLFLSRYEEHLVADGHHFPLSIARYDELWSPQGHLSLESFELVPFPSSLHRIGEAEVRREILMPKGQHAVLVRYSIRGTTEDVELELRPLLPFREADALTEENTHLDGTVMRASSALACNPIKAYPASPFRGLAAKPSSKKSPAGSTTSSTPKRQRADIQLVKISGARAS